MPAYRCRSGATLGGTRFLAGAARHVLNISSYSTRCSSLRSALAATAPLRLDASPARSVSDMDGATASPCCFDRRAFLSLGGLGSDASDRAERGGPIMAGPADLAAGAGAVPGRDCWVLEGLGGSSGDADGVVCALRLDLLAFGGLSLPSRDLADFFCWSVFRAAELWDLVEGVSSCSCCELSCLNPRSYNHRQYLETFLISAFASQHRSHPLPQTQRSFQSHRCQT